MTNDYLSLFLNSTLASGDAVAVFALFFLGIARILPILLLSPFFGAKVLPHPVKMTLAICLFVILLPHFLVKITTPLHFDLTLLLYVLKEVFIGTIMGFVIGAPFYVVQNAGVIIDHQRGGASLMTNDPTIQNQSSPLGTLYNMVMIFIFYFINGPFLVLDALVTSYDVLPPDKLLSPFFFSQKVICWEILFEMLHTVMALAIQLAGPGLIAILMTDLFLGIINRLAPQVQITFLGMPLKSLLALVVVCIGWKLFSDQLAKEIIKWLDRYNEMIQSFGVGLTH